MAVVLRAWCILIYVWFLIYHWPHGGRSGTDKGPHVAREPYNEQVWDKGRHEKGISGRPTHTLSFFEAVKYSLQLADASSYLLWLSASLAQGISSPLMLFTVFISHPWILIHLHIDPATAEPSLHASASCVCYKMCRWLDGNVLLWALFMCKWLFSCFFSSNCILFGPEVTYVHVYSKRDSICVPLYVARRVSVCVCVSESAASGWLSRGSAVAGLSEVLRVDNAQNPRLRLSLGNSEGTHAVTCIYLRCWQTHTHSHLLLVACHPFLLAGRGGRTKRTSVTKTWSRSSQLGGLNN